MAVSNDHQPSSSMTDGPIPHLEPEIRLLSRSSELHRVHPQTVRLEPTSPRDQGASAADSKPIASPIILETHQPDICGDSESSSDSRQQEAKRSQDALARYFSNAHSFPDYGAPKRSQVMTTIKDRLVRHPSPSISPALVANIADCQQKLINNSCSRPMNTLSSQRSTNAEDGFSSPPAKRQRGNAPAELEASQSPAAPRSSTRYLPSRGSIIDSPHHDAYEIQSTSSAGNIRSTSFSNQAEYRNAQSKMGVRRNRTRNSRNFKSPEKRQDLTSTHDDRGLGLLDTRHSPTYQEPDAESPDALSGSTPPPALVTSDVAAQRKPNKRNRPFHATDPIQSSVKRQRPAGHHEPIVLSEDELQADPLPYTTSVKVRASNPFTRPKQRSQSENRGGSRGDIPKTCFSKPPTEMKQRKRGSGGMRIARAVCGKDTYEGNDHHWISLYEDSDGGTRLEPFDELGYAVDGMRWLGFDIEKITSAQHSLSRCHIMIQRPRAGEADAKLLLEFNDAKDVNRLIGILTKRSEPVDGVLEKKMEVLWNQAQKYAASLPHVQAQPLNQAAEHGASEGQVSESRKNGQGSSSIKERLLQSAINVDPPPQTREEKPAARHYDIETRSSSRFGSGPASCRPPPKSWTDSHPDWRRLWPGSLVYPFSGRNRTTVDEDDITRLNEGEFLNDNLINFYLRYLQCKMEEEHPELLNKVYVFNTFFFEKLKSSKGKINYDGVKSWTAKIDLLSYDYIVVPVNEHAHWYLAIICNAPISVRDSKDDSSLPPTQPDGASEVAKPDKSPNIPPTARSMSEASQQAERLIKEQLEESTDSVAGLSLNTPSPTSKDKPIDTASPKLDSTQPKIITLDSLGSAHAPTCRALKEYLILEAKTRRGIDLTLPPSGMTAKRIPEQDNYCDCGVYILGYMREFLKDPNGVADKLLQKHDVGWSIQASQLRNEIRELLLVLQERQRALLNENEQSKRKKTWGEKDASGNVLPTSSTSPPIMPSPSPTPKVPGSFPESSPETGPEEATEQPKSRSVTEEAKKPRHSEQGPDVPEETWRTGKRSNESKSTKTLTTDSNTSSGVNGEPHFSASVSPIREGPKLARTRIVVELEARSPPRGYKAPVIAEGDSTRPHVVRDSSSSESEVQAVHAVGKRKRGLSLEITDERKVKPGDGRPLARPPGRPRGAKNHTKSPYFDLIDDGGVDELQEGPRYDGIDRSIDLTSG